MKQQRALVFLFIIFIIIILFACNTTNQYHNMTPVLHLVKPLIDAQQDPEIDFSEFKTFSVFPLSLIDDSVKLSEIKEKQLLYSIRNEFERKGYKFVGLDENPDFVITIHAESPYEEHYVPPRQVETLQYVPGKTINVSLSFTI